MIRTIIGAQWGDEGKGKIVDLFSQKANLAVRFHGGNNAGHTVINKYGKFPLHLIPAGIFNPKCQVIIGNGVILDLDVLGQEIEMLRKSLPDFSKRLLISPRCNVIMPYHKLLDRLFEEAKGKVKTGTTGRGIGPTYADKVSYNGIRLFDFLNPKQFKERLDLMLSIKNKIIESFGEKPLSTEKVYDEEMAKFKKIKPYVCETFKILLKSAANKKNIIFEGAQGTFLDNDWGTYPFVTASSMVAGNINSGSGLPVKYLNKITGIAKAYTTRVGAGPFPTELFDETGEEIRKIGAEFGATTGRPRRCGWLDLELVRFASSLNGFTDLVITKLDVLDSFKTLKICTGYTLNGKKICYEDVDALNLAKVKPVFKTMKGWNKPITKIKRYRDLPKEAKQYLAEIERQIKIPISAVSTGPERDQIIYCR